MKQETMLYYLDVNLEDVQQPYQRVHRTVRLDQLRRCFYYYLGIVEGDWARALKGSERMEGRGGSSLALLTCLLAWQSLLTSAAKDQHGLLRERSRVAELPGQDFNLSFAHYTGYITVHPQTQRTLFYWFVEAAQDPSSKPLLLWLNGGATHLSLSLPLLHLSCNQLPTYAFSCGCLWTYVLHW